MPKLTLNGKEVEFDKGMTVLQVCEIGGVEAGEVRAAHGGQQPSIVAGWSGDSRPANSPPTSLPRQPPRRLPRPHLSQWPHRPPPSTATNRHSRARP